MTILGVFAEDIDWANLGGFEMDTTSSRFRSGYARCSFWPPTAYAHYAQSRPFSGGAVTSGWLSFKVYMARLIDGNTYHKLCGFGKSGTLSELSVGLDDAVASKVALYKYDGTTMTKLETSDNAVFSETLIQQVDMHVQSFGASAIVDIYIDGSNSASLHFEGDVTLSDMTNFDQVNVGPNAAGAAAYYFAVSEIIVTDNEDTRCWGLLTCAPNEAGDANAWTGGYANIDEVIQNPADVTYVNSNDQNAQFGLLPTPTGDFDIKAVVCKAKMTKHSGSTPGTLKLGIKTGGTVNVDSGTTATTAWQVAERVMATNPVTTNPWTEAEIDALQLNLQSAA